MEKYNLAPADFASLFSEATTPKEMELMAQVKSEKKKPQSLPKPDSGTSDVGGSDDESFLKAYSEGRSDDHARAMKLMQKLK